MNIPRQCRLRDLNSMLVEFAAQIVWLRTVELATSSRIALCL